MINTKIFSSNYYFLFSAYIYKTQCAPEYEASDIENG